MLQNIRRRLVISIAAILGVISFGTIGYSVVEKWNFFDSLYMTIITLTTVG
jgi:voltage-gated potassium channel